MCKYDNSFLLTKLPTIFVLILFDLFDGLTQMEKLQKLILILSIKQNVAEMLDYEVGTT